MPKRVPLSAIGVSRHGKTIYPTVGEAFEFTGDEIAEINALAKASGETLIRKPKNEDVSLPVSSDEVAELADMTVAQLKTAAAERGVDLGEATRKDQILAVLEAAAAAADEDL